VRELHLFCIEDLTIRVVMSSGLTFVSSYVALWGLVLFQSLVILGLVRELKKIRQLAEDDRLPRRWPPGMKAPRLRGTDLRTGAGVESADLRGGEAVLLFLSTGCRICRRLVDGIGRLSELSPSSCLVVCHGDAPGCAGLVEALDREIAVVLDEDGAMSESYGVRKTPVAFVLDADGRILSSGSPEHGGELEEMVLRSRQRQATEALESPAGVPDRSSVIT
jgi:hypothetical protein